MLFIFSPNLLVLVHSSSPPHTCFSQEGGVWISHCLCSNGSVRWAIDDGVQSLLIQRLQKALWCGGTWKQRAAAGDPGWSLTIIKYYHTESGGWRCREPGSRAGVCWRPSGWSAVLCGHPLTDWRTRREPQPCLWFMLLSVENEHKTLGLGHMTHRCLQELENQVASKCVKSKHPNGLYHSESVRQITFTFAVMLADVHKLFTSP